MDATTITCAIPAYDATTTGMTPSVSVITPGGNSNALLFSYTSPAKAITAFSFGVETGLDTKAMAAMVVQQRFPNVDDFALAIVDAASPNLRNSFTRYFLNAKRPIDRRLIEPVSAYHPDGLPERRSASPVILTTSTYAPETCRLETESNAFGDCPARVSNTRFCAIEV